MPRDSIEIHGAREHNLRIDSLRIPKGRLVVFTGVSGSGKSSLAFDTLYAEGQRRYVESLSSYARQFLGQMDKPAYEAIRGLSPTIAIDQKSTTTNPRSTVGTITEIYDYLRVLWARAGEPRCPDCGVVVETLAIDQMVDELRRLTGRVLLLAPLVENRKGEHRDLFTDLARRGFVRVRVDGALSRLDEGPPPMDRRRKHTVELVVDRLEPSGTARGRLADSIETALREGGGALVAVDAEGGRPLLRLSRHRSCPDCGRGLPELSPQSFSFNSPLGMCPDCNGLGHRMEMDPALVVPDPDLSVREGAVEPWASTMERGEGWTHDILGAVARKFRIDLDRPWRRLTARQRRILLYGAGGESVRVRYDHRRGTGEFDVDFEGAIPAMLRRYSETRSEAMREHYRRYLSDAVCSGCDGARLRPESRAVRVGGRMIEEITAMSVTDALGFFGGLELSGTRARIAEGPRREIESRLSFLRDVGLDYLALDRAGPSLSGGEAQRIRLASQLGSELTGVLYILDEPTIGLHPRDNLRLIRTLERLRDGGNSVIVVEHDGEMIRSADHVIDFGPGAGEQGGRVVFAGGVAGLRRSAGLTGKYFSGRLAIEVPDERRVGEGELVVRGAREHNLAGVDVRFPLGTFTAVTGVSGAGKSSLVTGILHPALARHLHGSRSSVGLHHSLEGLEHVDKVVHVDQSPIGRTPRSNPVTYTKAFDLIREAFARTPEARAAGFTPGRFSFNVPGGRCEACRGDGVRRVEMHFLPDVYVPCDVCKGLRYGEATLRVRYGGLTISEVLDLSVLQAMEHFEAHPKLVRILETLHDVGLDYVRIGQPAPTLSGGEAQRVKLSRELARADTGRTFYILDEPTCGLHFDDVRKLISVLDRLVAAGNTVVVIEHHLDVIRHADHVIDLGPEGGAGGGRVVAAGTPEEVAESSESATGRYLREALSGVSLP